MVIVRVPKCVSIMKGKILKYFSNRGYGFIKIDESDDDLFFHISNFPKNEIPSVGMEVEFTIIETSKGNEAQDIRTIISGSDTISEKEPAVEDKSLSVKLEEDKKFSELEQIPGIGPKYQLLLKAANIKSIEDLKGYSPEILMAHLLAVNEERTIAKRPPTLKNVENWIEFIKNIE